MTDDNYLNGFLSADFKQASARDGFGQALLELGEKNLDVVALSADLSESTRANLFSQKYPERFFEVGVAEQNMACVAAGLAHEGKIPFITSFGVFSPGRNWDQIRVSICYSNANVKIIATHAGIAVGADGATHQALEDIALMRVLPNMVVISPCDYWQAFKATLAVASYQGPCFIRLPRQSSPVLSSEDTPFEIGKAIRVKRGSDAAIIAHGPILFEAIKAVKIASEHHLEVAIVNFPTIKPLDEQVLKDIAEETGALVVAEDHQKAGGLFGAISEFFSQQAVRPAIIPIGVDDSFGESARSGDELMEKYMLKASDIYEALKKAIKLRDASQS